MKNAELHDQIISLASRRQGVMKREITKAIPKTIESAVRRLMAAGTLFHCGSKGGAPRTYFTSKERAAEVAATKVVPKKLKAPKPIVFAKATKKPPKPSFRDLPVIVPPHVKVQKLPGYTGAPAWELRGKTWQS